MVPVNEDNPTIEFEHVTFGYDPKRPVLKDISFKVKPKQIRGPGRPDGFGQDQHHLAGAALL